MLLACFGGALLAQNFLLLPRAWRLPPLALILLGIYLLWRGDEATQRDPARRIPTRERRIRLPLGDAQSASLVIDAAAASIQLRAASDKTPAGAAREDAALLTGEYGSEAGFRRHFQHATILLDRRSLAELAGDNWRLRLAPELPWQLEIRSWLGELRLDCRALRLESAQCSSVFGALRFTAPARADDPLLLHNHFGDIRLQTLPDRSCRIRIHANRFTRIHRDPQRYIVREDGLFIAGSLAESAEPVMLELRPGLGDVFLE